MTLGLDEGPVNERDGDGKNLYGARARLCISSLTIAWRPVTADTTLRSNVSTAPIV